MYVMVFFTFSGIFRDFLADPQKTPFETSFAISGPESPETSVNGRSGRNTTGPEAVVLYPRRSLFLSVAICFHFFVPLRQGAHQGGHATARDS